MPNRSGRSNGVVPPQMPGFADWATMTTWSPWQHQQNNRQAETLSQSVGVHTHVITDEVQSVEDAETITEAILRRRAEREPTENESIGAQMQANIAARLAAEAETDEEVTYAIQAQTEQEEMGFASPEPALVLTPPEDPMAPHESDTTAIRHFRHMLEVHDNSAPDGPGRLSASNVSGYTELLRDLCRNQREIWVQNGGSNTSPDAPSMSEMLARAARSGRNGRSSGTTPRMRNPEPEQTFFGNIPETSTMTTVASQFGMRVNYPSIEKHPLIVGTHLAGVEIELENLAIEHPSFRYWTAKSDGSLRNNGMEFVCSHPWGGVDLYNAAVEIDGFLFGNNPDDTWRCSTHVHVDVRDMTAAQIKKMVLAYVFYERVLFKCSGWQRYKNNFCVALGFAQGQLEDLGNWWAENDGTFLTNLSTRWDKYTAINFLPMGHFGSIEFRLGEAKWHKGQLIRLTNRFLSLKEVALANGNLTDEQFVDMLSSTDPADVIKKGIPKGIGNLTEDLEVGFKLCHDILSLAKLRRRSRRVFKPNFDDGSRVITQPRSELFTNGWNHCVSHLQQRHPNLDFPDLRTMRDESGQNYVWNFAWLYELYDMMRRARLTFEIQWFMPQQNRSQLIALFERYLREQRAASEGGSTPEEAPSSRRRNSQPVPSPFEDDDDDEGDSSPEW